MLRASSQKRGLPAIVAGGLWGISGVLIVRMLLVANQGLIARVLDVPGYGLFITITTFTGTLITLLGLGLDTWLLHRGGQEPDQLSAAAGNILLVRGFVGGLCVAGFLVWRGSISPATAATISMLGALFDIQALTCYNALRARGRNDLIAMVQVTAALLVIAGVLFVSTMMQPTVASILAVQASVSLLVLLYLFKAVKRRYGLRVDLSRLRSMLRTTVPFLLSDGLSLLYTRWPVAAIAIFLGTTPVAWFAIALQIISLSYIIPALIFNVTLPYFSSVSMENAVLKRWFRNLFAAQVLYGIAVVAVLAVAGEYVISMIFGAKYQATADTLAIIMVVPAIKSISFACSTILVAKNRIKLRVLMQVGILIVSLIGSWFLIPRYGLVGAAVLIVGTEVLLMIAYSWGTYHILKTLP